MIGPRYYDKDGTPIPDTLIWARKLEDIDYKRIAQTILPDGKLVSTVWLGLNHNYGSGPPLIFETMVFEAGRGGGEVDTERYSTLAEAQDGHHEMVRKWTERPPNQWLRKSTNLTQEV